MEKMDTNKEILIYMIESPSAKNFYNEDNESDTLFESLKNYDLLFERKIVVNYKYFRSAIKYGAKRFFSENDDDAIRVLHLSMHGYEDGLRLTNGHKIKWLQLRRFLPPINNGNLILFLSACRSSFGQFMAFGSKSPFNLLVTNSRVVDFFDSTLAALVFYHLLCFGKSISGIKKAMNIATENGFFEINSLKGIKNKFGWLHKRFKKHNANIRKKKITGLSKTTLDRPKYNQQ